MKSSRTELGNTYHRYSGLAGAVKFRARVVLDVHEQSEAQDKEPTVEEFDVRNHPDDGHVYANITIPAEDMRDLVMEYLVYAKISRLEQLTGEEALKLVLEGRL